MTRRKTPKPEPPAAGIRDRIVELRRVPASELLRNPRNWRTHPKAQQEALRGVLEEIGYAGALLARVTDGGELALIDGHLRADTTPNQLVPVLILDVTEMEADKLLLTFDPLGAMAGQNKEALDSLMRDVQTGSEAVAAMLGDLSGTTAESDKPDKSEVIDPQFSILIRCADEPEQRAILEELDRHELDTRALCIGWPEPPAIVRPEDEPPLAVDERRITRTSTIKKSSRVKQLSGMFDLPPKATTEHTWIVKLTLDRPWNVGLICGPSGSGKSTIAREIFGDKIVTGWPWPEDAAVIDGFPAAMPLGDIVGLLSSVGFSSPPHWLKPFAVLSNGEQFRVNLARTLAEMPDLAVIDEFTSVVDRTVAQIGSCAVAKSVRHSNRRLVAVTCHNDVEEWLQPDWKYEPATGKFQWRLLRRRPDIQLHITKVRGPEAWPLFRGHHYLSGDLNGAAQCFMATINKQPAAFTAVLSQPHRAHGGWWREHRTVCLPDFQGVGIGNALADFVAGLFVATGKKYRSTTSHPAMIGHRMKAANWRCLRAPCLAPPNSGNGMGDLLDSMAMDRLTAGFEYIGPTNLASAERFGLFKNPRAKVALENTKLPPHGELLDKPDVAEQPREVSRGPREAGGIVVNATSEGATVEQIDQADGNAGGKPIKHRRGRHANQKRSPIKRAPRAHLDCLSTGGN